MNLVDAKHDVNFKAPNDKQFNPFIAYANGRDIFDELRTWELKLEKGKLTLSNEVGANYDIGEVGETVQRLSLAFFQFKQPYLVLEFMDEVRVYSYDLESGELKFLITFKDLNCVTLFYSRALSKSSLQLAAIRPNEGIITGELNMSNGVFKMDIVQPCSDTDQLRIHRFGLTVTNQLKIEVVSVNES